jgi:hypothetical protein
VSGTIIVVLDARLINPFVVIVLLTPSGDWRRSAAHPG